MKRLTAVLALLALAASLLPTAGSAATNEVRICGETSSGLTVAAGNYPQGGIPRTKCSFAWATNRAVRKLDGSRGLSARFGLKVRGQQLGCTSSSGSSEEVRCRNAKRFVLLYG